MGTEEGSSGEKDEVLPYPGNFVGGGESLSSETQMVERKDAATPYRVLTEKKTEKVALQNEEGGNTGDFC